MKIFVSLLIVGMIVMMQASCSGIFKGGAGSQCDVDSDCKEPLICAYCGSNPEDYDMCCQPNPYSNH